MNTPEPASQKICSTTFLTVLLSVSILTNIILVVKLKYPGFITSIQLSLIPAPVVLPSDHMRGNPTAKYTIIEYADFQCSYCAKFHKVMSALMKEADVRWIYRNFPLQNHPLAGKAAEAAECAGEQGKFWEFSDVLFSLEGKVAEEALQVSAQKSGLNWMSFGLCLNSGKYREVVAKQLEDGLQRKISGTPTFYLNGKRFDGFVSLEELRMLTGIKTE